MRILFLTRTLNMGGVEKNLVLLSSEFLERGHNVCIAAGRGVLTPTLEDVGVDCRDFAFSPKSPLGLARSIVALRALLRELRPDIVHVFAAMPGLCLTVSQTMASMGSRSQQPIVVSSIMGLQESPGEHQLKTKLRSLLTIGRSSRVYVISPQIKKHLASLPVASTRLVDQHIVGVLPRPVADTCYSQKLREQWAISTSRVVVTIGHLSPRKSHQLFVDAAERVLREDSEVTFLIVGTGPEEESLKQTIAQRGLSDRVKLIGLVHDLPSLFAIATICVKPGVVEGFIGVTVLEAQAMAVPVVAFDTEDVRLGIRDGHTGLIARRGDSSDLADKILLLLKDPNFAAEIAVQGQTEVRKNWSIEAIATDLLADYTKLLSEPNPN